MPTKRVMPYRMGTASDSDQFALRSRARRLAQRGSSCLGGVCFTAYRWRMFRPAVQQVLKLTEGGVMFSETWRRIFNHYYGVSLGRFTYGPGLWPGVFPVGTIIGSFCSIASGVKVLRRNHPTHWLSQHPLFFNRIVGLLQEDAIHSVSENPLRIGNDVWIGLNVIICPGCRIIGDGAIIAAGSVVTKDVPPFAIVGGNPARLIRKRYPLSVEKAIAESAWWTYSLQELIGHVDLFTSEMAENSILKLATAFPPRRNDRPTTLCER